MNGFPNFGGSAFVPPFAMPAINKGMNNDKSSNIDELVKNIDAQIAKLEEEERLEKENNQGKNKEEKENEFESLVNKNTKSLWDVKKKSQLKNQRRTTLT